jgi:peptidoglycan/LPS O-acetylase OafA/YrhL
MPGEPLPYRPALDGLRAFAVIVVVAYHAGVPGFSGGFIGVDMFFVLSGYLITGLLIDEHQRYHRIRFREFYARRLRRILPLAAVVLTTVAVAAALLTPATRHLELRSDIFRAVTFTANLGFAERGRDYLQSEDPPSAIQHWWSLAVEEQFYLIWPLLIGAAGWLAFQRLRSLKASVALVCGVVTVGSLAWAVHRTTQAPVDAFFNLSSRAWELSVGGLAAATIGIVQRRVATWCTAAGMFTVAAALHWNSTGVAFPGVGAVPVVVGTLLLCISVDRSWFAGLWGHRALTWIGERSYGWYLWSWPPLVIAADRWGRPLTVLEAATLSVASLVLAACTYSMVENPIRHHRHLKRNVGASLAVPAMLSVTALLVAVPLLDGTFNVAPRIEVAVPLPDPPRPTASTPATSPPTTPPSDDLTEIQTPTAPTDPQPTVDPTRWAVTPAAVVEATVRYGGIHDQVPGNLTPELAAIRQDVPITYRDGCHRDHADTEIDPALCRYGNLDSDVVIALVGDSHATQWHSPLVTVADQHGWQLWNLTKSGCPTADILLYNTTLEALYQDCRTWLDNLAEALADNPVTVLVVSNHGFDRLRELDGTPVEDLNGTWWAARVEQTLLALTSSAQTTLWFADTPTPGFLAGDCVARHLGDRHRCALNPQTALDEQRRALERDTAERLGLHWIDTARWLCTDQECPAIVGNIAVYRDRTHLTDAVARWLTPYLDRLLADAVELTAQTPR